MKRSFFLVLIVAVIGVFSSLAYATTAQSSANEARAHKLFKQFRCMVCTGESIDESDATLAVNLRQMIREKIEQGETDEQITAYMVERYGKGILFAPPVEKSTWFLWGAPFLLLLIAVTGVMRYIRR